MSALVIPGRYEVLARDLRLYGIANAPHFFWVVKGQQGMCLIESSEEDAYWIREDELERALAREWIRYVGD